MRISSPAICCSLQDASGASCCSSGTSLCVVHRARAPSALAKAVVTRQKSSRLTTCPGAQPSTTRKAAEPTIRLMRVASPTSRAGRRCGNQRWMDTESLLLLLAPPCFLLSRSDGSAWLHGRCLGTSGRGRQSCRPEQPAEPPHRAGLRSVGDAPRAAISSSRAGPVEQAPRRNQRPPRGRTPRRAPRHQGHPRRGPRSCGLADAERGRAPPSLQRGHRCRILGPKADNPVNPRGALRGTLPLTLSPSNR
jgi:hypothetical protein